MAAVRDAREVSVASEVPYDLRMADQWWEGGSLSLARESYLRALALDPKSSHAAFQLAWIDASFERRPAGTTFEARLGEEALERLRRHVESAARLPGGIERWDIDALRRRPDAAESG